MTTVWTTFDYEIAVRRKGHRKSIPGYAAEESAFDIPSVPAAEAPAALRIRTSSDGVRVGIPFLDSGRTYVSRIRDGVHYSPFVRRTGVPYTTAEFDEVAVKLAAPLGAFSCLTTGLRPPRPGDLYKLPLGAGLTLTAEHRERDLAVAAGWIVANLLDVDGQLYMRTPEPMIAVALVWKGSTRLPALEIGIEYWNGRVAADRSDADKDKIAAVAGYFRLDQADLALTTASEIASTLGLDFPAYAVEPGPEVLDASLLGAAPADEGLKAVMNTALKFGHEALLHGADDFVLAWADMQEALRAFESGHADASALCLDALNTFARTGPKADCFSVAAVRDRWLHRTQPLLRAALVCMAAHAPEPMPSP